MWIRRFRSVTALAVVLAASCAAPAADHPVPDPAEGATAWGKPVDGLQAGLRCPRGKESIRPGEEVTLEVVLRNVTEDTIPFEYLPGGTYLGENSKGTVEVTWLYIGKGVPTTAHIRPREEMLLGQVTLCHVRPKSPNTAYAYRVELPPGKFQVGSARVVPGKGDPTEGKLGTGYLDLELLPKK